MLSLQEEISEYVGALEGCADLDTVRDRFHAAFEKIGFSTSTYVQFHLPEYDQLSSHVFSQQMVVSTTLPDEWRSRYREQNYHRIDPVFHRCRQCITPQVWLDVASDQELDQIQRRFFGEAIECGLPNGVAIPIHGPKGEFAVVSLSSDEPASEFVNRITEYKHTAHLLAINLHVAIHELLKHDTQRSFIKLTPREQECLKWTARGKSSWAISEILVLSERTVNFHLTNAITKLDASNRTHAVAKSIHHGLIQI